MEYVYKNVDGANIDDCDSVDYVKYTFVTAARHPDKYGFAEREAEMREEEKRENDLDRILEEYGY